MRKSVKVLALSLLACGLSYMDAAAQYTLTTDMEARPIHEYNTISMTGSPYLHPDWAEGAISLSNGTTYQGINIMYDQVKDVILFKNKDDQVMELIEPVKEFSISYIQNNEKVNKTFRKGYSSEGVTPDAFLEVLADGKTTLLKRTTKNVFDRKGYSSATIEREVQESQDYYVANSNKLLKVKKSKGSLLAALPGKADELQSYIKTNSLNLRNDSDMAKLVAYYNSL
ncbi:hypothetical protein [Pontibacter flavimaris]|uniref:Uncharacterized protein n=1 Tax=Pontibacter flavimaris TaxID=1797110 RepID=A0A1Q5PEI5_9BACT|nr:hypothetical protein [Pontibacter flavimaris]OKL40636.1 hypothetical protein A3841_12285 [Pontibacter flavimaris]